VHPDIMVALKERKYSLQEIPSTPPGPRAYVDGYIAKKNGCLIETNNERKLLAVDGLEEVKFVQIMQDLISMAQKDFNFNLNLDLDFMELSVNVIVVTEKNPIDIFRKLRSEKLDKFYEILENESMFFGLRIAPKNLLPSSKNWYDFQIQPRLTCSEKEYYISAIYRSEDGEKVMNFSRNINSKLVALISLIEEE
jgi:hypothetical protein